MEDELINILLPEKVEEDQRHEEEDYSTWLDYNGEYVPATDLKLAKSIPAGEYKVIYTNNSFRIIPVTVNTDELYEFSGSYTEIILKEISDFWNKSDIYKHHNIVHKRGILLEGPPGNGKSAIVSLLAKHLIEQHNGLVFLINNYKDFDLTSDALVSFVRKIEPSRPIITIIEDIDKLIESQGGNDSELLDFMDGKMSIDHHLVVLISNNTSSLSSALLRPSRIDLRFVLNSPNDDIRREYFKLKGISENKLNDFVKSTSGFSFAELKETFIGTEVLGKPLKKVIAQIKEPFDNNDYLNGTNNKLGI